MYFISRNYSVFPENPPKTTDAGEANVINKALWPMAIVGRWLGIFPTHVSISAKRNAVVKKASLERFPILLILSLMIIELLIHISTSNYSGFHGKFLVFSATRMLSICLGRFVAIAVVIVSMIKKCHFLQYLLKWESVDYLLRPHEQLIRKFSRRVFVSMMIIVLMFEFLPIYYNLEDLNGDSIKRFWYYLRLLTSVFEICMVLLYPFSCAILCKALEHGFQEVNAKLRRVACLGPELVNVHQAAAFRGLREKHEMLADLALEAGKLFSPLLTVIIFNQILSLCFIMRLVVVPHDLGRLSGIYRNIFAVAMVCIRLPILAFMCFAADRMTKEALNGLRFIYEADCSCLTAESKFELYLLISKLRNCPVVLTASGFWIINIELLLKIIGITVTYSIVVVQNSS